MNAIAHATNGVKCPQLHCRGRVCALPLPSLGGEVTTSAPGTLEIFGNHKARVRQYLQDLGF